MAELVERLLQFGQFDAGDIDSWLVTMAHSASKSEPPVYYADPAGPCGQGAFNSVRALPSGREKNCRSRGVVDSGFLESPLGA